MPRACSTVQSALPGPFAADVEAHYAIPGRAKSKAPCAQTQSGTGWYVSGGLAYAKQALGSRGGLRLLTYGAYGVVAGRTG